jgi:hypothetical protein
MLTNVFYYSIYKPFIMQRHSDPKQSAKTVLERYSQNSDSVDVKPQVTKNASIKRSVSSYVEAVCRNVIEMRDCAKYLSMNAGMYYSNVLNESIETSKQWAEEDISMFVNAFNAAVAFGLTQEHSPELARYADDLREIALYNKDALKEAGVSIHNNGMVMSFSAERIHSMNMLDFGHSTASAGNAAREIYGRTSELLQLPASAHMDFRQLSYYYNYRVDLSAEIALRKIPIALHAGLIFDRVI